MMSPDPEMRKSIWLVPAVGNIGKILFSFVTTYGKIAMSARNPPQNKFNLSDTP
jgi:hypothetical protein